MKEIYYKLSSSFLWISRLMFLILSLGSIQIIILLFSKDFEVIKVLTIFSVSITTVSVILIAINFWWISEDFKRLSKSFEDPILNSMNKDCNSELKIDDVNDPEVLNDLIKRMNQKK
jgi:hypothetical protein